MSSLGSLVISLSADTSKFQSDMGKAAHISERNFKSMMTQASAAGMVIGSMLTDVIRSMGGFISSQFSTVDAMLKTAQMVGMTTENFSVLTHAASLAGVEMSGLKTALTRLTVNMADAASGTGDAKDVFQTLGISVVDASGKIRGSYEVLEEFADKMANMDDDGRAAYAVKLLGKSGADLIPLLLGGSKGMREMRIELEALGGVLSDKLAKDTELFNDNLTRMQVGVKGVAYSIMEQGMPTMNAIASAMVEAAKNADKFSTAGAILRTVIEATAVTAETLRYVLTSVGNDIGAFVAMMQALATLDFKGAKFISDELAKDSARAREEHDRFLEAIMGNADKPVSAAVSASNKVITPIIKRLTDTKKEADKVGDRLKALMQDVSAIGLAGVELEVFKFKTLGATEAQADLARVLYEMLDAEEKHKEMLKEAASLYDSTRTPLEVMGNEYARLNKLMKEGFITADTYARGVAAAQNKFLGGSKDIKSDLTELQRAVEGFGKRATSAFVDWAFGAKVAVGDMVASIMKDLAQMLIYENITRPLFGMLSSSLGSGTLFGGGRAAGGPVVPGQSYLVGEHGPERFTPQSAGTINSSGAGGNVTVYVDASGSQVQGDSGDAGELGRRIAGAVRSVLITEKRPGGMLS